MANHKSAIKRARQSEDRRLRKRSRKTRMKNVLKVVEEAVTQKSPEAAAVALKDAVSILDKAAGKGLIHKNKASRKISRLTRRVNALTAKPA